MGGNNVKLPVIDVAVPIVGFYAAAPYLVVLMHLNLLLQLQLLSRKLFAFDAVAPTDEEVGGAVIGCTSFPTPIIWWVVPVR